MNRTNILKYIEAKDKCKHFERKCKLRSNLVLYEDENGIIKITESH